MSGGIRGEGQVMLFGLGAEMIKNDAGLDSGDATLGIDFENVRHVSGEVENDGSVAALSG
jgi:hypothetical protein